MKKLPYTEGDVFVVPLRTGGFGRGLVARLDGKGIVFGFFFGPRLDSKTEALADDRLRPQGAVLCGRFGDLGLLKGEWPVIGSVTDWDRESWPLPAFLHVDEDGKRGFRRYYSDSLAFLKEERVIVSEVEENLPRDSLMGYGAVEIRLGRLLKEQPDQGEDA